MTAIIQLPNGSDVPSYPVLTVEGSTVVDSSYAYGDVRRYGALLAGADETQALINAAAALQAIGGGTLLIPGPLSILSTGYASSLPASPFIAFTSLNGIRIVAWGTITVNRVFTPGTTLDLFTLTSCSGVDVDIPSIVGDAASGASQLTPTGVYVVRLLGACRNVDATINGTNMSGLCIVTAAAGAADTARTKGIRLDLVVNNCEYGFNAQFSGDDVEGKIISNQVHRSYFIYGVRNHRVRVESKNNHADDCLLRAYSGYGCEEIDLTYINKGSTSAATAAPGVSIAPDVNSVGGFVPGVMRNITITVHVEYDGTNGPGHAIYLYKTVGDTTIDTTDRGHIVDGLTIRAYVKGANSGNSAQPMLLGGTWGGGETMSNIRVERFECDSVNAATYLYFPSLKDRALIMNAIGNHYFYLYAGTAGKITAIGCKGQALVIGTGDTSWIDYIDCEVTAPGTSSFTNKTYIDTMINGSLFNVHGRSGGLLGFYGVTAVARQFLATGASHTVDDVITLLQNLGLARQT